MPRPSAVRWGYRSARRPRAVTWPRICVGVSRSGSFSRSIGNSRHFRSNLPAQSDFFTSNGTGPMTLPTESLNSPVSRRVKKPERNRNLSVLSQMSGSFCRIQFDRLNCVAYSTMGYLPLAFSNGTANAGTTALMSALRWSSHTMAGRRGCPSRSRLRMVARWVVRVTATMRSRRSARREQLLRSSRTAAASSTPDPARPSRVAWRSRARSGSSRSGGSRRPDPPGPPGSTASRRRWPGSDHLHARAGS